MPLDDRLRDGLQRDAGTFRPDVEDHLDRVHGRGRRRSEGRVHGLRVSLAATAVVIVVAIGLRVTALDPRALMGPLFGQAPPATSSPSADPIAGTYSGRLAADTPDVAARGFTGEWTLTFGGDSSVSLIGPPESGAAGGQFEDDVYAVIDDRLVTTLFSSDFSQACAGAGTYRWTIRADRLLLERVEDTCPERVVVLGGTEWVRTMDAAR